tara:strand:+ start:712 stop:1422 length:711 start_codon:yes stop_codon:yes gene_type:complete
MSLNKLVTVCTIACNAEDTLSRFFNWVYTRFEHIVIVTSESEDNTVEIVQNFVAVRPERFTHIHKEMSSFAAHKQLSLDAAPTEWKLIVDADEIFEEQDWDRAINVMPPNINMLSFPRYNLQKDEKYYHKESYPDYQTRLVNSKVHFDKSKPVHETLIGEGRSLNNRPHIIHWGHLRAEKDLKMKSIMRTKYAIWDRADGPQLLKSDNWFAERNEKWDEQIKKLPESTYRLVKQHL